jgi:hypothetical protein
MSPMAERRNFIFRERRWKKDKNTQMRERIKNNRKGRKKILAFIYILIFILYCRTIENGERACLRIGKGRMGRT